MKSCRYTGLRCAEPLLKCEACGEYRRFREGAKRFLRPVSGLPDLPDPCPYVKFVTPSGNYGIEIGVKGTF